VWKAPSSSDEPAAGGEDAGGDLAPVGDEELADVHGVVLSGGCQLRARPDETWP
jgi:hypothetical protein